MTRASPPSRLFKSQRNIQCALRSSRLGMGNHLSDSYVFDLIYQLLPKTCEALFKKVYKQKVIGYIE